MLYQGINNWPKPPSACPASMLKKAAHLTPICVAGLVILRPKTRNGKRSYIPYIRGWDRLLKYNSLAQDI